MKDFQTFSRGGAGQSQELGVDDYATVMELIPHPILLIDALSGKILTSNSRALELSAYTQKEFIGLLINTLLPEWDQERALIRVGQAGDLDGGNSLKNATPIHLVKRDQTKVIVATTCIPSNMDTSRYLLALQPYGQWGFPRQSHQRRFWESIKQLVGIQPAQNLNETLEQILEIGGILTSANILAIYSVSDREPLLIQCAGFGAYRLLPEQLPIKDLMHIEKTETWSMGRRSWSTLQRAARKASLPFLVSVPIGQRDSAVGLLVVADTETILPDNIQNLAELLAALTSAIIQKYTQAQKTGKKIEEHEKQEQTAAILEEKVQEGIVYLDKSFQIININTSAELMLGYTSFEINGQPFDKVLIGTKSLQPALEQAKEGSPTYNIDNVRLYRRNGDSFLAMVRIFPVLTDNVTDKIIVFIQDLSEQEKMHRQAQEFEQRAILGDVTAIFAHEVRNPINNISTGLQLMALNLAEDDPNQESIDRMLQDCDRLAALIKSVLAFSRPIEYEMEILDVPMILNRLLNRLNARITRLNIQYEIQSESDCPPIEGNLRALEQVFTNLIQNAIDAMALTGGRLGIKIQTVNTPGNKEQIQISIADTGPGIPKEQQENIFQPFVTTKRDGTGLGLAIAKQIITAHKGDLGLTSFPGGTVFQVRIPVANQTP